MLFQRQFERLYFAVERIAHQLESADPDQRAYLVEELTALREMGSQFFDLWVGFEDRIQELVEDFAGQEAFGHAAQSMETGPIGVLAPAELFRKGIGYFDLSMFAESQAAFARMVEIDPEFTVGRLYLGLSQLANRDWEAAERQLTLVELTAGVPLLAVAACEAKANLYAERGMHAEALRELRRVLAQKPEYVDAHVNAAVCAYAVQDYAGAVKHASRATELAPDDAQAWRLLGASLHASGQFQKAWRAYREAALLAPGHAAIQTESGHAAFAADRQDAAQARFRRALALAGRDGRALSGLAHVAEHQGDYGTAVALLKKAISLNRKDPAVLTQLGWALCVGGRLCEAERVFLSLEEAGQGGRMARSGRARIAALQGDLDGARSLLRTLLTEAAAQDSARDKAHALTELARIEASCGRIRTALRCLRAALRIDGSYRDALVCLGTVLARNGLPD